MLVNSLVASFYRIQKSWEIILSFFVASLAQLASKQQESLDNQGFL